ncbi:alcohol dehydrogenase catalytic domain-containing protein [Photobacterium leiognathi]|uniref:alcohol dehydrogenase catalytic domain-containing protein n=1 Tax=Photobacterium leiognathi TaxID=553611 RepID=UPI0027385C7A|nr:zinc-binding dehydrogenase [Photobacterium leiognathi]
MKTNTSAMIVSHGEPHSLRLVTTDMPEPAPKEVRVKIIVAGVGWADIMARRGGYPLAPKLPFVPGYEFAGVIDEVGDEVSDFNIGDSVVGLNPKFGCYTQYLSISPELLVKYPKHLSAVKVCALSLNYLTAHCMLFSKAKIQPQQSILVHSAAGGVGSALAQLANQFGVRVFGTASSNKQETLEELGVYPIDYNHNDFVQEVLSYCPSGVDAAFDSVGGEHLNCTVKTVKKGGIAVSYGFSGGSFGGLFKMISGVIQLYILNILPNGKSVDFCALPSEVDKNRQWYKDTLTSLISMLEQKKIDPIISSVVPLFQVHKAHEELESGKCIGKVLVQCAEITQG